MKKAFLLIFTAIHSFSQVPQRREFQEGNTTELIIYEKALPAKTYDFKTSDLQVKWHVLVMDLLEQTPGYTPLVAARNMAYINLAAYQSILPAYKNLRSLSGQLQGFVVPPEYLVDSSDFIPELALNNAIFATMDKFFLAAPYVYMERVLAHKDSVDSQFSKNQSKLAVMKSKNYGISVAELILKYAEKDGAKESTYRSYDINYKLPKCDSCFEINRTADLENTGPLHPDWGKVRTFIADNQKESDIRPGFDFSIYKDSKFYKQALEVYTVSKEVTPGSEKHRIANFWDDAATYTYTPIGHSLSILTHIFRNNPTSIDSAAVLYANLSLAMHDAFVITWGLKYKYNLIRPVAYIKKYIDSAWETTLLTPPFPEFPSGHSAQSAAMATVLTKYMGDSTGFTDYSKYWTGAPKTFKNFWESANETSISRLYGGIHYREGLDKGQLVGKLAGENALKLKFFGD